MVTRAVSQFIEIINFPMACKTNSKNENVASSPACMVCAFFIAIEHPELMPTYPQPTNPKGGSKTLLQLKSRPGVSHMAATSPT